MYHHRLQIRRLVNLAYLTVPESVRDTLAKQHFIEALADSEMRIRIKQSRPQNLNDAIRLAVELETYESKHQSETYNLTMMMYVIGCSFYTCSIWAFSSSRLCRFLSLIWFVSHWNTRERVRTGWSVNIKIYGDWWASVGSFPGRFRFRNRTTIKEKS
jgi:hypothetical protein